MSKSEYKRLEVQIPDAVKVIREQVLENEIDAELAVIRQAIAEARHAQSSGAEWYTKGHSGLFMQVRMWLDKADKAIIAIENLKNK